MDGVHASFISCDRIRDGGFPITCVFNLANNSLSSVHIILFDVPIHYTTYDLFT